MNRIYILLLLFSAYLFANPDSELTDGYYVDSSGSDSILVESTGEGIILSMANGERINFTFKDGKYRHQIFPENDYYDIKIESAEEFGLLDNSSKKIAVFTLYKKPSFFNKLIAILVGSALFISIFQTYLKVNKIWKRRKIAEVANSISIVASLMGFAVLFPFLMNSLFITSDYPCNTLFFDQCGLFCRK